ncbi:MAG TPA: low affinity iron permease family protein [Acidimicrobiales bacterium]
MARRAKRATNDASEAGAPSTVAKPDYPTPPIVPGIDHLSENPAAATSAKVISRKTSQLPLLSKAIYHIDHYTSMSSVVAAFTAALVVMLALGAVLRFPSSWVISFDVAASSVTLLMVFTIQHTQGREQVATQRKLDELLRAIPGAAESLMMLEEAPKAFMLEVEENQREVRNDHVIDATSTSEESADD